jgi:hypothetical protein
MFARTHPATRHPALGEPSPLLSHIAGPFAAEIAGLWPAPHAVFLTTTAPRRHLLCLWLARGGADELGAIVEAILHGAFKAAVAAAAPDAPAGLRRALEQMGESAWPRDAYLTLLDMLAHPQAAKTLRHTRGIDAEQVCALAALPRPMLDGGGGALGLDLHQARLAAEVYQGLSVRDGEAAAEAACRRWGAAATANDALGLMREAIVPQLPPPPFVGTARLRPLRTQGEMRDASLRYRNCLRERIRAAAWGSSAFYEWLGEPRTVVEIRRDELFGWRLDEARLVDNEAVPESARVAICAELRAIGIHVGRADWQLREALDEAVQPRFVLEPEEAALDQVFMP